MAHYDYVVFADADLATDKVKQSPADRRNRRRIARRHPIFRRLKSDRMYTEQINVPYHPSAIAYYREKGIQEKK